MFTSFHISHFHIIEGSYQSLAIGLVFYKPLGFLHSAMKGNILLQTVVCSTLIVPGVFLETFLRSRENEQRSGEEREKNLWLRLACSASVFWAGESCFVLLQIAVAGIFDFMTEEDGDRRNSKP